MVKRFVGGITIGTPNSTTIGTNAQGIFTSDSLVQSTSISTGSAAAAAGIYGGTPTANATSATYVVVAGGQSGSTRFAGPDHGAGGGGGEVLQGTITGITAGAPGVVTITVGGGGSAPASTTNPGANGNLGSNSSISGTGFSTVTARRGGNSNAGNYATGTGGTSGNGNAGSSAIGGGGGNGGAGGAPGVSGSGYSGQGGRGTDVTFAGVYRGEFGGGGGGGSSGAPDPGKGSAGRSGGEGGGYNTSNDSQASGESGLVNTGGGGGGHGFGDTRAGSVSGNGASGRAFIQVLIYDGTTTYYTPVATGTYTQYVYKSGANAYSVYDFTGSGTLTF
jgi:hypothetical protein